MSKLYNVLVQKEVM